MRILSIVLNFMSLSWKIIKKQFLIYVFVFLVAIIVSSADFIILTRKLRTKTYPTLDFVSFFLVPLIGAFVIGLLIEIYKDKKHFKK